MQVSKLRFSNDPLELLPEHRNQAKREAEGHLKMAFDDNLQSTPSGCFFRAFRVAGEWSLATKSRKLWGGQLVFRYPTMVGTLVGCSQVPMRWTYWLHNFPTFYKEPDAAKSWMTLCLCQATLAPIDKDLLDWLFSTLLKKVTADGGLFTRGLARWGRDCSHCLRCFRKHCKTQQGRGDWVGDFPAQQQKINGTWSD